MLGRKFDVMSIDNEKEEIKKVLNKCGVFLESDVIKRIQLDMIIIRGSVRVIIC